ncbi:hypothetical protein HJG54_22810 [Leptolyngbya sp. NK1-12]|uniref:Uncharacterized protein n=1 Tax=Leptolyngbya sp. NK1-12 TaxID=2547451 RepID=A0AA96WFX0_9CYAN|nr:hypothetical protein [Leptolyngbya sp. NK1-12]WNZ25402.1 hypothetical protein HJG54_22810 [Leptolyngbya sp. NK1-12]
MFQWGFKDSIVNGLLDSLLTPVQDWLSQYPTLLWLAMHPLWLLGTILLLLFLLSGLLRAIARVTEKLWLWLLMFPVTLVRWLWQGTLFLLSRPFSGKSLPQSSFVNPPALETPDRLTEVLNRLESLRQEQNELLQEVKVLLAKEQKKE